MTRRKKTKRFLLSTPKKLLEKNDSCSCGCLLVLISGVELFTARRQSVLKRAALHRDCLIAKVKEVKTSQHGCNLLLHTHNFAACCEFATMAGSADYGDKMSASFDTLTNFDSSLFAMRTRGSSTKPPFPRTTWYCFFSNKTHWLRLTGSPVL